MKQKPTPENVPPALADDFVTVRALTPREYWRFMDFTDADFDRAKAALNKQFHGGRDKSNSRLYAQAGNSIPVSMIGRQLAGMAGLEWPETKPPCTDDPEPQRK